MTGLVLVVTQLTCMLANAWGMPPELLTGTLRDTFADRPHHERPVAPDNADGLHAYGSRRKVGARSWTASNTRRSLVAAKASTAGRR